MGVSGSGKTTLGKALAEASDGIFLDGDDYHTTENREKMAAGQALTDADRRPWLLALGRLAEECSQHSTPCFIACSALKQSYRETLRSLSPGIQFLHLHADATTLRQRIAERREAGDHFMPPSLLDSQLDALQPEAEALLLDTSQSLESLVATFFNWQKSRAEDTF